MVVHLYVSGLFPMSMLYDKAYIAATNPFTRFGNTLLVLFGDRVKYYFAWKVAEGASILGGFGFEGYDKEGKPIGWRGVENIDIIGFETAYNVQVLSRCWNKRTQGWLERYTYHRTDGSLVATYFISALWHGLYPGFFLFFMSIPLLTQIERLLRVKLNPLIIPGFDGYRDSTAPPGVVTFLYWQVSRVCTVLSANYIVQVFSLLSWDRSMTALGSYHHIPHFFFLGLYLLLQILPTPKSASTTTSSSKKSN